MTARNVKLRLVPAVVLTVLAALVLIRLFGVEIHLRQPVDIAITEKVLGHITFPDAADVLFPENFSAQATFAADVTVPLERAFSIPLNFDIVFPIDTRLQIDGIMDLDFDLPLQLALTPEQLDVGEISVSIDSEVMVDDELALDFAVPIDSTLQAYSLVPVPVRGAVPVRVVVPIRKPLRIRDRLRIKTSDLSLNLDTVVPVKARVPIVQDISVRGEVKGRIQQTITVPISENLSLPIRATVPVDLRISDGVRISLDGVLPAAIEFRESFSIIMGTLELNASDIGINMQGDKKK